MKSMFLIRGNICGDRVRIGRAMLNITQEELAQRIQRLGLSMTKMIVYSIEKKERHVCDAELCALAKALGVSMDWLVGNTELLKK